MEILYCSTKELGGISWGKNSKKIRGVFCTLHGCREKDYSKYATIITGMRHRHAADIEHPSSQDTVAPFSDGFKLSTSLFRRCKAAKLQPPSYLCQIKKTASFMQYPQENYHPLTTEPAAALNDTLQNHLGRTI